MMDTAAPAGGGNGAPVGSNSAPVDSDAVGKRGVFWLGAYFVVSAEVLLFALLFLWVGGGPEKDRDLVRITLFGATPQGFSAELWTILVVAVTSALGSYVHAATSFVGYVGNKTLTKSWIWWYILRTPIGVALALVFYFSVRGGLLSAGTTSKDLNSFGVAALAGMVGMFSKQATDKLREVFDTLFKTGKGGDEERKNKLQ